MLIGKEYIFDAAHHIVGHDKCGQPHGHTWTLEVMVDAPLLPTGMVIDFNDLNTVVRHIVDTFDHTDINAVVDTMAIRASWLKVNDELPVTAETLVRYFVFTISLKLRAKGLQLTTLTCRLREGLGGWAQVSYSHGELL